MKYYCYARVSTDSQKEARQYDAFSKYAELKGIDIEAVFLDKMSGSTMDRPQYKALKSILRRGDCIIFHQFSRIGRPDDYEDTKRELEWFRDNGVHVVILDLPMIDVDDENLRKLLYNLTVELFSYFVHAERQKIRENVRSGIAAAKKRGVVLGRPKLTELPKSFYEYYPMWREGPLSAGDCAKLMGVTRQTLYRYEKIHLGEVE